MNKSLEYQSTSHLHASSAALLSKDERSIK